MRIRTTRGSLGREKKKKRMEINKRKRRSR